MVPFWKHLQKQQKGIETARKSSMTSKKKERLNLNFVGNKGEREKQEAKGKGL